MREVNFDAIQEHVSTQYGDMTGVVQIDGIDNVVSIYTLCSDNGFNTDDKFIIGFGLGESTIQGIGEGALGCSILYLLKSDYGNNYDEIESKIKSLETLTVKKKHFYISYKDLGKYIKRFDLLLTTGLAKYANTIEIEENDLEEDEE